MSVDGSRAKFSLEISLELGDALYLRHALNFPKFKHREVIDLRDPIVNEIMFRFLVVLILVDGESVATTLFLRDPVGSENPKRMSGSIRLTVRTVAGTCSFISDTFTSCGSNVQIAYETPWQLNFYIQSGAAIQREACSYLHHGYSPDTRASPCESKCVLVAFIPPL